MLLAAVPSVPWWSLPAVLATVITVWLVTSANRTIIDAGLAGDAPKQRRRWSPFRGESARSLAEAAANSSISIGRDLDEVKYKLEQAKVESEREKAVWNAEKDALNVKIDHLTKENDSLRELVTDREWAQRLIEKIDANHRETLAAVRGRS